MYSRPGRLVSFPCGSILVLGSSVAIPPHSSRLCPMERRKRRFLRLHSGPHSDGTQRGLFVVVGSHGCRCWIPWLSFQPPSPPCRTFAALPQVRPPQTLTHSESHMIEYSSSYTPGQTGLILFDALINSQQCVFEFHRSL